MKHLAHTEVSEGRYLFDLLDAQVVQRLHLLLLYGLFGLSLVLLVAHDDLERLCRIACGPFALESIPLILGDQLDNLEQPVVGVLPFLAQIEHEDVCIVAVSVLQ